MSERHTDKSGDSIMTIDISQQHLQSGIKKKQLERFDTGTQISGYPTWISCVLMRATTRKW